MGYAIPAPMSPEEIADLADRVEAAIGSDRELDCLVEIACGPDGAAIQHIMDGSPHNTIDEVAQAADRDGAQVFFRVPRYTGSLDAAMALVPNDAFWRVGHDGEGADPSLIKAAIGVAKVGECWVTFRMAVALTGPLALCAAALRAIAHLQKGQP